MTASVSIYINPTVRQSNGRRDAALEYWTDERLAAVKELCQRHASLDDFNAVFPAVGITKLWLAMRYIIATECRSAAR